MGAAGQNPLEKWIFTKTGGKDIKSYQLEKLRETLRYAAGKSKFYKEVYHCHDIAVKDFKAFEKLPFVTADDLIRRGPEMLCVPQNEIGRIVTLNTSGTTQEPKRVYFTDADQELTIDFFHNGMQCLINANDNCMILLPYKTPGSVGDLLSKGLTRTGCGVYPYGLINDFRSAGEFMAEHKITSLVGSAVQVLKLAELTKACGFDIRMNSVLLSTDYVPDAITARISALWGCKVFEHYGMTEMCFGGGVYCEYLKGYHLREADLYFEIISESGETLPQGEYGEVVFTTLTRTGMPLIRYRTGDHGRFSKDRCGCSGRLMLMEKIRRRTDGGITGSDGRVFYISDFDELIFSLDSVTDYSLDIRGGKARIRILTASGNFEKLRMAARELVFEKTGLDSQITVERETGAPQEKLIKRQIISNCGG